jgi:hypothetical protein
MNSNFIDMEAYASLFLSATVNVRSSAFLKEIRILSFDALFLGIINGIDFLTILTAMAAI